MSKKETKQTRFTDEFLYDIKSIKNVCIGSEVRIKCEQVYLKKKYLGELVEVKARSDKNDTNMAMSSNGYIH